MTIHTLLLIIALILDLLAPAVAIPYATTIAIALICIALLIPPGVVP
jgi:hypothetical protein